MIEDMVTNLSDDDRARVRRILGPNPGDDQKQPLFDGLALLTEGATLTKLPIQYEVEVQSQDIESSGYHSAQIVVKAYGAQQDDAEAVAEFARRVRAAYVVPEGDGE